MNKETPIPSEVMENICRLDANTNTGLTGTEIGSLLADSLIEDTGPIMTKWKRLFNAFAIIKISTYLQKREVRAFMTVKC